MRIDVNTFLGEYPFRAVPGGDVESLLAEMDRLGIDEAWTSNLSAIVWKDPAEGNAQLYRHGRELPRLRPVPAVHPGLAGWADLLREALDGGAPAVRCDPTFYGLHPVGAEVRALVDACAEAGLILMMAVRLEDGRQRHPNDVAPELLPWAVRGLIRMNPRLHLIVTHADRDFIEQVHFGSTPEEARRVLWDISWVWGPPEDHLELLLRTVGLERFTFGTGMPLRIGENAVAKLDLLGLGVEERKAIEGGNLRRFQAP